MLLFSFPYAYILEDQQNQKHPYLDLACRIDSLLTFMSDLNFYLQVIYDLELTPLLTQAKHQEP